MKKMKWMLSLIMLFALAFTACENGGDDVNNQNQNSGDDAPFTIEVFEIGRTNIVYNVLPEDESKSYITVVMKAREVEGYIQDAFLINDIVDKAVIEAGNKGLTKAEFLESVTTSGEQLNIEKSGLIPATDYYVVLFEVDPAKEYKPGDKAVKEKFTTESIDTVDVDFDVDNDINGNNLDITITPSVEDTAWHLILMPTSEYTKYTYVEGDYAYTDYQLFSDYMAMEVERYAQAGFSSAQIAYYFPTGEFTYQAYGLTPNASYTYLIAGVILEDGVYYCNTEVKTGKFETGESTLALQVSVTAVTSNRAAIRITPSNNNDTYAWLIAEYDGTSTAEEIMNDIIKEYGSAFDSGYMLYTGIQDYTGGIGSPYKYRLDAPDTEYFCIVFGYAGGQATTEPVMEVFKTLPATPAAEVVFTMTGTNPTPYGFNVSVTSSDEAVYYEAGVYVKSDDPDLQFDMEKNAKELEDYILDIKSDEMYAHLTIPQIIAALSQNLLSRGDVTLPIAGAMILPETTYNGYLHAIDQQTGKVAKTHIFENLVTTKELGAVQPAVEVLGYFSGDDENGQIWKDPNSTKGFAITVVKYSNFDGARSLFTTMVEDDKTNMMNISDAELWGNTLDKWTHCKVKSPYTFYITEWNKTMTALVYAVDSATATPGALGRCMTCATPDNKGTFEELLALYNEANAAEKSYLSMPASVVYDDMGYSAKSRF